MRWAKALHCFPDDFQCRLAVPALGNIAFQHVTFVINRPPKVVLFTIDLHKSLVQMPSPIRMCTKVLDPLLSDLGRKQRAETVPPEPDRFMADIDTALVQ
jgi:hypothetical protein